MKKSKSLKEKVNQIKGKIKNGIHRRVVRYAPAALGVLTSWLPVNLANATADRNSAPKNKSALVINPNDDGIIRDNTYSRLALTSAGSDRAYTKSIAQISIATESESINPQNPAAVATGNGYYGQHQFGISSNSGYMARKYIAYALANGSEKFCESLMANLLTGSKDAKRRLVEAFIASTDTYLERGEPEKAYMPSNPAYKRLFDAMSVTTGSFSKVHNQFPEEGFERQKMFVYEVYLNLMPRPLKQIIAKHPRINFEEIHPAVMGSIIAIAVKQGNGIRLDNALNAAERENDRKFYEKVQAQEKENFELLGLDTLPPLTVASRTGALDSENITARGHREGDQVLTIYDKEGKLSEEDIITEPGRRVIIAKTAKPKNAVNEFSIVAYDVSNRKIDTDEIINNAEWLNNYCRGFNKVYQAAVAEIDKIPTLDTYMEMSIILNKPQLYDMIQKTLYQKKEVQEGITAQLTPDMFHKSGKGKEILLADNTRINKISLFRENMRQYREKQKNAKIARIVNSFTQNRPRSC